MLKDFDINISHGAIRVGLTLSIILFCIWLARKIIKKRSEKIPNEKALKYTNSQRFGIFSIIFFLAPWSFLVLSNLAKGAMFLSLFIFNLFRVPFWLENILESLTYAGANFMIFAGIYSCCEYFWPKKKKTP